MGIWIMEGIKVINVAFLIYSSSLLFSLPLVRPLAGTSETPASSPSRWSPNRGENFTRTGHVK